MLEYILNTTPMAGSNILLVYMNLRQGQITT